MNMRCQRCAGLLVWGFDAELRVEEVRCVNCAYRPLQPVQPTPPPHGLMKVRIGNLVTCRCGNLKVEWRSCCATCSLKTLHHYQRKAHAKKYGLIAAITKEMRP